MNKILKILLFSDILIFMGFGLVTPILAIFIKENLVGGTIFAAGLSVFIFWITKSAVQLPLSRYVDRKDHRIPLLIAGTFIMTFVPISYIFINHVRWIYLVQILYGLGSGMAYPCWLGLWSTNLDKHHESFEWSVYSTFVGIGAAIAAAVGGVLAQLFGFRITFVIVSAFIFIGGLVLFGLEKKSDRAKKTKLPPKQSLGR